MSIHAEMFACICPDFEREIQFVPPHQHDEGKLNFVFGAQNIEKLHLKKSAAFLFQKQCVHYVG